MRSSLFFWCCCLAALFPGSQSAHWTTTVDGVEYACQGNTVTLPWNFALDAGDTITEIEWYFSGASEEMIAMEAHGGFLSFPAFANRVEQVNDAGIRLTGVLTSDSGNYSVAVNGFDSNGEHFRLTDFALVQISDDLQTPGGVLQVVQHQEAVLDPATSQWSVELQCGPFTFRGDPPYPVEWIAPSGDRRTSSNFRDGHFNLLLPNPVQGGTYTCRIPSQHLTDSCIHGTGPHRGEASLLVDKVEARLDILESENAHLKQRVQDLEDIPEKRVGFQATGLANSHPSTSAALVVNIIRFNQGNAYDTATGYFTAPYDGIYFFIGTSGSGSSNTYATLSLYKGSTFIDSVRTYDYSGHLYFASVHGIVHLNAGETVHLRSGGGYFYSGYTTFSGFLISPDP